MRDKLIAAAAAVAGGVLMAAVLYGLAIVAQRAVTS